MSTTSHEFFTMITTFPNFFPINCYLVKENDALTLIDAGIKRTTLEIKQEVRLLALPVTKIIITHGHSDHLGDLVALKKCYPDAKIYFPFAEQQALEQNLGKKTLPVPVPIDYFVKDGDQIGSLTVIETPGHSYGSISLLDGRDQTIFVADLLQSQGGLAVSGDTRWLFPFPSLATWNFQAALDSAEKILALKPTTLAFGHGKLLDNPISQLTEVIAQGKNKAK